MGNPKIPILCYHRVCPVSERGTDSPSLCVTPEKFRQQMALLKFLGYRAVSIQDIVASVQSRKNLPRRSVAITFDDGYEDNYRYAFPALKDYSFAATIFLVTDFIGGKNSWDSGTLPLLNETQIGEMATGGIIFGAHTATHIDLTKESPGKIREELARSKKRVEELTSRQDIPFCYPYSRLNATSRECVKECGYCGAVSGDSTLENCPEDIFEMTRVQVFPSTSLLGFWKKIQPWYPRWMKIQKNIKERKKKVSA